ncbi:MAG: hypothetical protein N3H31_01705 [Candidatus Nezhaarchaeota archaeon]|nr:hypothetical protein [Candidatus Nezhaarchaeota archaeon]
MKRQLKNNLAVSSVVGGLVLMLLFISMVTGLMIIQREHRAYVDTLREFQAALSFKAAEELRAFYTKDGERLVVTATNPSPLSIQVAYVVITQPGGSSLLFSVNYTIPPGLNASILSVPLNNQPSSVSLVTSRGNIFTAELDNRYFSQGSRSQEWLLREWPEFTSISIPTKSSRYLVAASEELVAWTDGLLLIVYDWSGYPKVSTRAERGVQGLVAFSGTVIYVDGDHLKAVRGDGTLAWSTPGFSSEVRPYICVEETGTIYVKTYTLGRSHIHAVDINTGSILLRITDDGRRSYLRSDGELTIIATSSQVALYSRGKQLSSLGGSYFTAWVDADRGIVALASRVYSEIRLELYDLSFNSIGIISVKPPVASDYFVAQDLEFTEGGIAIFYFTIASGSYDRQFHVMCIDPQGRVVFNELVARFGYSEPPVEETGWFRDYLLKVWSLALFQGSRPKLLNSSVVMELPNCEAVVATKLGKAAFVCEGSLRLTKLPHVPKSLPKVSMEVSRNYVLLRSEGPPQKIRVFVHTQSAGSAIEAALKLVSKPQKVSHEFSRPSGTLPLNSELIIRAGKASEGRYIAEVVAEAKKGALSRSFLVLDVRAAPTLVKYSSTLATSSSYLFFSTSDRFEARRTSSQALADVVISYRASTPLAGEWGGVIHEVYVPKDLPGPPYIAFRIEDGYDGPRGAWEALVMVCKDGAWKTVWREDLGGRTLGLREVQVSLEGVVSPGSRVFVALALACLSREASTSNVWIKLSGVGLPSLPTGYYLTIYSKDRIVIKGVGSGQVIKVYSSEGSLLGRAEATGAEEILVALSDRALSPYRNCTIEIYPVNGVAWTTNILLYGGDILVFTG